MDYPKLYSIKPLKWNHLGGDRWEATTILGSIHVIKYLPDDDAHPYLLAFKCAVDMERWEEPK